MAETEWCPCKCGHDDGDHTPLGICCLCKCKKYIKKDDKMGEVNMVNKIQNSRFEDILEEMLKMHRAKSHDYAGTEDPYANLRISKEMGIEPWKGVILRMGDKFSRLQTFARQGELEVKDESVKDTFQDMAIYAIIGMILFEDEV